MSDSSTFTPSASRFGLKQWKCLRKMSGWKSRQKSRVGRSPLASLRDHVIYAQHDLATSAARIVKNSDQSSCYTYTDSKCLACHDSRAQLPSFVLRWTFEADSTIRVHP